MKCDCVIFGGGVAGLWLLDLLARQGRDVLLLEAFELGRGQTVASQGILHCGLRSGTHGSSARSTGSLREMPLIWRQALAGEGSGPNLSRTRVRTQHCYLWHMPSSTSRAARSGTRTGSPVSQETLSDGERPEVLRQVAGTVTRLPEQIIEPASLVQDLMAQHRARILKFVPDALSFELRSPGEIKTIRITDPKHKTVLDLIPQHVVLTAGEGNARLRQLAGLTGTAMRRRPLHMAMVRGHHLPELNGHCLDGAGTRLRITCDHDSEGRSLWQLGGQIAETGVTKSPEELIQLAAVELTTAIPGLAMEGLEWSTSRIDRAEAVTPDGHRPEHVQVLMAGNVTTGWPTKLVLAPALAQDIAERISSHDRRNRLDLTTLSGWTRPEVALPPWELTDAWHTLPASQPRTVGSAA